MGFISVLLLRGGGWKEGRAHQVGEGVELLAHHAALLSPARYRAVEGVKEEAEGQEGERRPQVAVLCWVAEAVAHRGEEGEDAAEAWEGGGVSWPSLGFSGSGRAVDCSPFSSVMKSARCSARTSEKWPASVESRSFCLSITVGGVSGLFAGCVSPILLLHLSP